MESLDLRGLSEQRHDLTGAFVQLFLQSAFDAEVVPVDAATRADAAGEGEWIEREHFCALSRCRDRRQRSAGSSARNGDVGLECLDDRRKLNMQFEQTWRWLGRRRSCNRLGGFDTKIESVCECFNWR